MKDNIELAQAHNDQPPNATIQHLIQQTKDFIDLTHAKWIQPQMDKAKEQNDKRRE